MGSPQRKIACLWKGGEKSIQEVLDSREYKALLDIGLRDASLFLFFPINSRFRHAEKNNRFIFCQDRVRLLDCIRGDLGRGSLIIPVVKGIRYHPQSLSLLDAVAKKRGPCLISYSVAIEGKASIRYISPGEITPWNWAVTEEAFLPYPGMILDLFSAYLLNGMRERIQPIPLHEEVSRIENPVTEKEYQVFKGYDIPLWELQTHIDSSNYLLSTYVKRASEKGEKESIKQLPYELLNRIEDVPRHEEILFHPLREMEALLAEERWDALRGEAARNISHAKDDHFFYCSLLYRAISYANMHQIDKALSDLLLCMEKDSTNTTAHFIIGKVLLRIKKFEEAGRHFKSCSERAPHDLEAFKYLSFAYLKGEHYGHAVSTLEYTLKVFNYDPNLLKPLLHACYMENRMDTLSKYSRYIEPFPPLPADFPEKEWILIFELLRNSEEKKWFIDVGANQGTISRQLALWGKRCLVIEPDVDLYSELLTKLSDFNGRAIICKCACSSKDGEAQMHMGLERGFNTLDRDIPHVLPFRYHRNGRFRTVKTRMLKGLLSENGIEHVSLLKLDVEGHELDVLKGLDWKYFESIDLIFFEFDLRLQKKCKATLYYLFGCGFVHGLMFQHPTNDKRSHSMIKLTVDDVVKIEPKNGVYGNILLSKEPLFSFEEATFINEDKVIPPEEVMGRILQ